MELYRGTQNGVTRSYPCYEDISHVRWECFSDCHQPILDGSTLFVHRNTKMSADFHDHFSQVAAHYADFRPHYPAGLFDYLATLVPRDALVWDCAAGSGQATIDLAARFDRVIATDASAQQVGSAPRHENVEYRVALAEESDLPDQSVCLVTVAQALHWFNHERFFREAKRVLKPGGILAVWVYATNQVEGEKINSIVQDFYSNIVGPYWPPERKMTENGYRTITLPFAEIRPPSFCMEVHWNLNRLLGYFGTWSATNRFVKATGMNPLEPLKDRLAKVWGNPDSPRHVVWPLSLRVGCNGIANSH
jgi:ubiquinone/menaquinone biosynthesis C-methylase UbiE